MRAAAAPGVTAFAFARLLNPAPGVATLTLTHEGHLMITLSGELVARTDALLLASENLETRPLKRRMQGRAVPDVFHRLVTLEGEGHMILAREDESFYPLQLQRDLCFFVEERVWAIESSLMWDAGLVPGSRSSASPIPLVRIAGEGKIALRVPGELVAIKIAPHRPYRVRDRGFVGWVGNVVPRMVGRYGFVHCEGEGAALVSLPVMNQGRLEKGTK